MPPAKAMLGSLLLLSWPHLAQAENRCPAEVQFAASTACPGLRLGPTLRLLELELASCGVTRVVLQEGYPERTTDPSAAPAVTLVCLPSTDGDFAVQLTLAGAWPSPVAARHLALRRSQRPLSERLVALALAEMVSTASRATVPAATTADPAAIAAAAALPSSAKIDTPAPTAKPLPPLRLQRSPPPLAPSQAATGDTGAHTTPRRRPFWHVQAAATTRVFMLRPDILFGPSLQAGSKRWFGAAELLLGSVSDRYGEAKMRLASAQAGVEVWQLGRDRWRFCFGPRLGFGWLWAKTTAYSPSPTVLTRDANTFYVDAAARSNAKWRINALFRLAAELDLGWSRGFILQGGDGQTIARLDGPFAGLKLGVELGRTSW